MEGLEKDRYQTVWSNLQVLGDLPEDFTISIVEEAYQPVLYNSWSTAFYRWHNGDNRNQLLAHIKATFSQALQQVSARLVPVSYLSQVEKALGGLDILLRTYEKKLGPEDPLLLQGQKISTGTWQHLRDFNLSATSYTKGLERDSSGGEKSPIDSSAYLFSLSDSQLLSHTCSDPPGEQPPLVRTSSEEAATPPEAQLEYLLSDESFSSTDSLVTADSVGSAQEQQSESSDRETHPVGSAQEQQSDSSARETHPVSSAQDQQSESSALESLVEELDEDFLESPFPPHHPTGSLATTEDSETSNGEEGKRSSRKSRFWSARRRSSRSASSAAAEEASSQALSVRSEPDSEFIRQCCAIC